MKARFVISILMLILVMPPSIGFTQASSGTISNTSAQTLLLGLAEAVFRFQFERNGSIAQQTAAHYALKLFGIAPPQQFLNRFHRHTPAVIGGSGTSGDIHFRIDNIRWSGKKYIFYVEGGYSESPISFSGNRYTVEFKNGEWYVTRDVRLYSTGNGAGAFQITPSSATVPVNTSISLSALNGIGVVQWYSQNARGMFSSNSGESVTFTRTVAGTEIITASDELGRTASVVIN